MRTESLRRITAALAVLVAASAGCASDDDVATPDAAGTVGAPGANSSKSTTSPPDTSSSDTSSPAGTTGSDATDETDADEIDAGLRDELLEMLELDQAVRTGIAPPGDDRSEAELFAAMDEVDAANQERLAEILDEYGWPGWSLVGEDGSTAAWAIVQHADLDPEFQVRGLALLEAAVEAGDASPGDLAYLVDRVRVGNGEPQVYGTQWGAPIDDEAGVDARRASVGLGTLAEYHAELEAMFDDD